MATLHAYAPINLGHFLDTMMIRGDVKVGKARSSHTAHLTVPHSLIGEVALVAARNGLICEVGRHYYRGKRTLTQLIVKVK